MRTTGEPVLAVNTEEDTDADTGAEDDKPVLTANAEEDNDAGTGAEDDTPEMLVADEEGSTIVLAAHSFQVVPVLAASWAVYRLVGVTGMPIESQCPPCRSYLYRLIAFAMVPTAKFIPPEHGDLREFSHAHRMNLCNAWI